ncbi:MAG: type II toxin-antitoxin system VapB family antitoxin [Bryobacteraceae bacterium]
MRQHHDAQRVLLQMRQLRRHKRLQLIAFLFLHLGLPSGSPFLLYPTHMKRTNLVLDEKLLAEATRTLGVKTYSAAVNLALAGSAVAQDSKNPPVLRLRPLERRPERNARGQGKKARSFQAA